MNSSIAILQLMHAQGLGYKKLNSIVKKANELKYPLEDVVYTSSSELEKIFNLKSEIASSIINMQEKACKILEELEYNYINILVKGTKEYPQKLEQILGENAPPVLFAKGNIEIIQKESVGFCGSRKVSEKGYYIASEISAILAKKNINIVSGYAQGIDMAAHLSAMNAGGVTTIILATGILHFKIKNAVETLVSNENHLIVSEFLPRLGWSTHNAMQRNKTICGLSNAVIIVESGLSGGTFEAGKTALELNRPLFVAEYANGDKFSEGNRYFLKRGAISLKKAKNGKPNLKNVFKVLKNNKSFIPQKSIFD